MIIPLWPKVPLWHTNAIGGLTEIREMLRVLGDPHLRLPPTIHIAGTNGKGSSLATFRSIYEAAGYRVHSYSSPHLLEFNERIYLAGKNISDDYINNLIARVRQVAEIIGYEPSFFQGTTVMAFLAFAETHADILILETGMGGRLDPTNVIEHPILTLITPVSYDHTEHLGQTLEKIAFEKSGIMKEGSPCIISAQHDNVYQVLFGEAEKKQMDTLCYEYDFGINANEYGFEFLSNDFSLQLPQPALAGFHQYINTAAVIASVFSLNKNFNVTNDQIRSGIVNTSWPGRIEEVKDHRRSNILADNFCLFLDGAHNQAGAQCLAEWIKTLSDPTIIILGMTKNRNPLEFLAPLKDCIIEVITVTVESEPSSYESTKLAKLAEPSGINISHQYDLEEAFSFVSNFYGTQKVNVIVTGSLFLVADFYKLLKFN